MDKRFGLKTHCIKDIINILSLHNEVEEAIIFGSRAMGTYKNGSDIDIALKGGKINFDTLANIRLRLDELPYLYMYDIIDYKKVSNSALTAHIDELGIVFYKKEIKPSEWKTYKLGKDVVTKLGDGLHGTPNYDYNGEYYFINGSNLVNGKIVINSNTKKVTETEFIKYKKDLSDKTILLGINGTIGNVAMYNNEMCVLGKSAAYLNINDDFDKNFVRYVLTNDHFQNYIKNNASGTTIKNVGLGLLREYEFSAPQDKTEQQQIAQILSSLDDKIELNLKMNQTLEAMAQATFKEWFVDFKFPNFDGELVDGMPKGWKECLMRDFGKIICGKTPSKAVDEYFGGEYMFIKIPDMHNSVFIIETTDSLTELGLNSQTNKTIPPYSICISSIATVGLVCINPEPCQTNQQINTIVPKNSFLKYYLYFLAISMKETFLATSSGGTATLNMNTSQFSNLNAIMPSENIMKEFDKIVSPMMDKILENNYCNQALIQTRDTLLPKLMSGKIEIKN